VYSNNRVKYKYEIREFEELPAAIPGWKLAGITQKSKNQKIKKSKKKKAWNIRA